MSIIDSLLVSGFGFSIVFIVLVALSFLVKLQSLVLNKAFKTDKNESSAEETDNTEVFDTESSFSTGVLKLINVDERTAAMIMAIVSDESKIPLHELQFKSIKAMD